jgi:hypothetical protein
MTLAVRYGPSDVERAERRPGGEARGDDPQREHEHGKKSEDAADQKIVHFGRRSRIDG